MNRAMLKAQRIEAMKREAGEVVEKEIMKINQQIATYSEQIETRLRDYVEEKNRLSEDVNKEIEAYEALYRELEAMCREVNIPIEEILMENAEEY